MSIESAEDVQGLTEIGAIVAQTLRVMADSVRPGITTKLLDEIGLRELTKQGAKSSPALVYKFPGATCISLNAEAIHGIPGERIVQAGDLVKLDVTAQKNGYVADAAISVPVPPVSPTAQRLIHCAEAAFNKATTVARAGNMVSAIGRAVEKEVKAHGFAVLREWCGHGVGRTIHEPPEVPNYFNPLDATMLTEGMVITIEPIITAGIGKSRVSRNGWTAVTNDGALSSHYEHTIIITKAAPIVLTRAYAA